MKIKIDRRALSAVIFLPEKSVREASVSLGKEISSLLSDRINRITFDMTQTQMIDSATLGVLIHMRREYPDSKVVMEILNAKGYVRGLLENAKFTSLFNMRDSEETVK